MVVVVDPTEDFLDHSVKPIGLRSPGAIQPDHRRETVDLIGPGADHWVKAVALMCSGADQPHHRDKTAVLINAGGEFRRDAITQSNILCAATTRKDAQEAAEFGMDTFPGRAIFAVGPISRQRWYATILNHRQSIGRPPIWSTPGHQNTLPPRKKKSFLTISVIFDIFGQLLSFLTIFVIFDDFCHF